MFRHRRASGNTQAPGWSMIRLYKNRLVKHSLHGEPEREQVKSRVAVLLRTVKNINYKDVVRDGVIYEEEKESKKREMLSEK